MKEVKLRKGERGSITLFVLISMMFFLMVVVFAYTNQINKISEQKKQIAEIEKQYNPEEIDEIYNEIESNMSVSIILYKPNGEIYNVNDWTNEDLTLKILYPGGLANNYKYYYIDGIKKNYEEGQKITKNCTIEVEYNNYKAEVVVSKIDKIAPIVTLSSNGGNIYIMPTQANATIKAKVTASDLESGLQTTQYAWSNSNTVEPSNWETFTTGNELEKANCVGGNYYLWTKVIDVAGNRAENIKVSNAFIVKTANYSIAKSGTTSYYSTLAEAHEGAVSNGGETGGTIKIIQDVTDASSVNIEKTIALDTNGKTLTRENRIYVEDKDITFTIKGNGTITNSVGSTIYNRGLGIVKIEEGTITTTNSNTIYNNGLGTVKIEGGIIENRSSSYANIWNNVGGKIEVTGGTITSPSVAITNATNGSVVINGGEINVTGLSTGISNKGEGSVEILKGTITSMGNSINNNAGGTVTITNGTITTTNSSTIYNNGLGTVKIEGGTIENRSSYANVYNSAAGKIEVTGGNIISVGNSINNNVGGTVTITNGTITTTNSVTLYNNGIGTIKIEGGGIVNSSSSYANVYNASTGKIEVTGGIITSDLTNSINNHAGGAVTITGGTVTTSGSSTIFNNSTGTIKMTGGSVKNTSSGSSSVWNNAEGKIEVTGGFITSEFTNCITNYAEGTITITGGSIVSSAKNAVYNTSIGIIIVGSASTPISCFPELYGTYGVYNPYGKLYFYNGRLCGRTAAYYRTITETRSGATLINSAVGYVGTETYKAVSYQ